MFISDFTNKDNFLLISHENS